MKRTIYVTLALLLIASLVLCGCKKAEEPAAPSEGAEETEVDQDLSEDLSELEGLDEDLAMDDLEDIEKDLEGLDW